MDDRMTESKDLAPSPTDEDINIFDGMGIPFVEGHVIPDLEFKDLRPRGPTLDTESKLPNEAPLKGYQGIKTMTTEPKPRSQQPHFYRYEGGSYRPYTLEEIDRELDSNVSSRTVTILFNRGFIDPVDVCDCLALYRLNFEPRTKDNEYIFKAK